MPASPASSVDPLYLAIDQGGGASRAIVYDGSGAEHARGTASVGTQHPRPGWVEHDPQEVVGSILSALEKVVSDLGDRDGDIEAAGLATQRSSIVCWDRESGEALSPIISWQDRRAADLIDRLAAAAELVRSRTGLVLSPHYGASKLRWCLDELPEVRRAHERGRLAFGPLASFLLYRLLQDDLSSRAAESCGGQESPRGAAARPHYVDPATASRTLLWDLETHDWSPELAELFGVPRDPLPQCVPSRYHYGQLALRGRRIPLTVTTGDQSAALYAFGAPQPTTAFINLGTGAFLQRVSGNVRVKAPGLLNSTIWQEGDLTTFVLEGTVNGAGGAVTKVAAELGIDDRDIPELAAEWLERSRRPGSLPLFLNGVSGLGSPYWIPDFPTQFVGRTGDASDEAPDERDEPWERMVAVYESIVFLLTVNLEEMANYLGPPETIVATGGLANLDGLCQRLADLSGIEVIRPRIREATAIGTAFLVAGAPSAWPGARAPRTASSSSRGTTGASSFRPATDAGLQDRFHRWRHEIESFLG